MTDWIEWHAAYEDPDSPLARRLEVVRDVLEQAVASHRDERLRVLSLCAGDGRDVLPVLARWRGRKAITGRLIESEPRLVEQARAFSAEQELEGVDVVCGDAALSANYLDAVPADLVLACGIFGNVADADIRRLIDALPALCGESASVVWTRHRRAPDLTPTIRSWFAEAGFEERGFFSPGPGGTSVGWHRLVEARREVTLPESLFTFVR